MNQSTIALWKLDFDEGYFRIYDSKKMIAGYFDPDYGQISQDQDFEEAVTAMIKDRVPVPGGFVMVPLVKFRLFDTDLNVPLSEVERNVLRVAEHLEKWKHFFRDSGCRTTYVRISHTDQDMLTVTFPVIFSGPTPLDAARMISEIAPTLDRLQNSGLL